MVEESCCQESYSNNKLRKMILISSGIAIGNVCFSFNYYLALIFCLLQVSGLLYLFVKGKYLEYFCFYLICTTYSLEFDFYNCPFWSLKNFRFLGINLCVWLLIPLLASVLYNMRFQQYRERQFRVGHNIKNGMLSLAILAIIIGALNIYLNDNNIRNLNGYLVAFGEGIYTYMAYIILPMFIFSYFIFDENRQKIVKSCINAILAGAVIAMVFASFWEMKGQNAGQEIIISNVTNIIFGAFTLLVSLQYDGKFRKMYLILGILGVILSFKNVVMGKILVILFAILVLYCLNLLFYQGKKGILICLIFAALIGTLMFVYFPIMMRNNHTFQWKMRQLISMLTFWEEGWWENMESSPKARLEETLNIFLEYVKKPLQIFLGKGLLGSFESHTGMYQNMPNDFSGYTKAEWENRSFYNVHETFNVLFLSNGLLGIGYIVYILKVALRKMLKNPYIVMGAVWFMFFYGYSMTISCFGIACLLLGGVLIDERR